jgi:hypothetical protein
MERKWAVPFVTRLRRRRHPESDYPNEPGWNGMVMSSALLLVILIALSAFFFYS